MKKLIYSLAGIAALLFNSCSGFLDEEAYDKFDKDEAYKSPTLVYLNTVGSIYNAMGPQGLSYSNYAYLSEFTSDLSMIPGRQGDWVDGGNHQNAFLHTWSPSFSMLLNTWNDMYKVIGLCNSAYEDIQDILDKGGDTAYQAYQYEIRACRAYYYYHALNLFAKVPVITSSKVGVGDVTQPERSEVYEFLRDELAEIIPHLPDGKCADTGSPYYGRMTKATGYMMMAKLALNAPVISEKVWHDGKFTGGIDAVGSFVTNTGKDIKITLDGATRNAWETVIYCYDQITLLGYNLAGDFESNFKVGNEGSVENIFIRPNDTESYKITQNLHWYSLHYAHAGDLGFTGGNGICGTVESAWIFGAQYDAVTETADYSRVDPRWDMSFFYGDVYVNGNRVGSGVSESYNPYGSYLPFDARIDYSVSDFADPKGLYTVKWGGSRVKKVELDKTDKTARLYHYTNADFVVYRYADIMLMAAEAKYRLGDIGGALSLINQIRDRVGAPPRISLDLQSILDERAIELMWEPVRREDLVRFGMYTEATRDKYAGVPHANSAGDWIYDATGYTTVFPIPIAVLNLNQNLTQNNGY